LVPSIAIAACIASAEAADVAFERSAGEVHLTVEGEAVARYVYNDEVVKRPYLASVRAPGGIQVTRNHPPIEGTDATDHATYHPGIWMAFGDLGGADYWRNRARVVHDGFLEAPRGGDGQGSFAVRNVYQAGQDPERVVCREACRLDFYVRPSGYLLLWDSTFSNDERAFTFGDQEEMGLGVRVATPITEQNGGTIRDSDGRTSAASIWGKTATWCDYSGVIDGCRVGVTLMCHPDNFRKSWMHARDYGLLAGNPFGRQAFGQGPKSSVVVEKGEELRLRYGVWIYATSSGDRLDVDAVFADFVKLASGER
jgi:hypothetical protein